MSTNVVKGFDIFLADLVSYAETNRLIYESYFSKTSKEFYYFCSAWQSNIMYLIRIVNFFGKKSNCFSVSNVLIGEFNNTIELSQIDVNTLNEYLEKIINTNLDYSFDIELDLSLRTECEKIRQRVEKSIANIVCDFFSLLEAKDNVKEEVVPLIEKRKNIIETLAKKYEFMTKL